MTRFTHAIIVRIPDSVRLEGKQPRNLKPDVALARKEQEDMCEMLREAGLDLIELAPENDCYSDSLLVEDVAVCINGTALVTRPTKASSRKEEVIAVLRELAWQVIDTPAQIAGKPVILHGSDVLFTGKELFVGVHTNGTGGSNVEGALAVGKAFPDFPVVPIRVEGGLHLKRLVCLAATDVLSVGKWPEAQNVLKRLEREATYRYKTISFDEKDAVNCIQVNGTLLYRADSTQATANYLVLKEATNLVGVSALELTSFGGGLSSYCLLIRKIKTLKNLW